jgi:hypothetical protein
MLMTSVMIRAVVPRNLPSEAKSAKSVILIDCGFYHVAAARRITEKSNT